MTKKPAAPVKKKPTIQLVSVTLPGSNLDVVYAVRHNDPRQAKAWLIENRIKARRAEQDEVIDIATNGSEIFGPFEETALDAVDDSQLSLDVPPVG